MSKSTQNKRVLGAARTTKSALLSTLAVCGLFAATSAFADYRFTKVDIQGNNRIEASTILTYAGIAKGQVVTDSDVNDAYNRIYDSGLFETVELVPSGATLKIIVTEFPTINRINIEGNQRLKDEVLKPVIQSKSRYVYKASVAESDAAAIAEVYAQKGRLAAKVTPKIIKRSDNRVDLVFEVFEGGVVEIERIGFVGNKAYTDRRLRRALQTKQAGFLRALIQRDTLVEDRIEFDKQLLRDFYLARGYIDFDIRGVNSELSRERDGVFLTFNVVEGQQFAIGDISVTSEMEGIDAELFRKELKSKTGQVYSPSAIENDIARMERFATRKGLDFLKIEPRITRNDRNQTLDFEFVISKGPRIFVERIDIEGNTETLDQVIRSQFKIAEGDPFDPRAIREAAERIRALGYFGNVDVNAREGSSPEQMVVDVNVEEVSTGSLSLGGTYSSDTGFGALITYNESNFLGRGQSLGLSVSTGTDNREYSLSFGEPRFLGRDVFFGLDASLKTTNNQNALYDTEIVRFSPSLGFSLGEFSRLNINYTAKQGLIKDVSASAGSVVKSEGARGKELESSIGYDFSYDTRRNGIANDTGILLSFGQDFGGIGGDNRFIRTNLKAIAQKKLLSGDIVLTANFDAGVIHYSKGSSTVLSRFALGPDLMRGFDPAGIGPRQRSADGSVNDALGGTKYAALRLEAAFPLGLPEEYGISGGVFYDIGSLWGIDSNEADILYKNASARQTVGMSIFWTTPIGPLRFNFSRPLKYEQYDKTNKFNFTISTKF